MAQLASASGLGPEGPVFESQYPDLREVVRLDDLFFRIWPGLYAVQTVRAKCIFLILVDSIIEIITEKG